MSRGKMPPPMVRPWVWYKVFTRLIDDARFLLLSVEQQRHYMLIYCCKASGLIDRHEDDKEQLMKMLALKLRVEKNELELAVMKLWEVKLLHLNSLQPVDWEEEQAAPPTPGAARVARHRASRGKPAGSPPTNILLEGTACELEELHWPNCVPTGEIATIKTFLMELQGVEKDGVPLAQLVLDELDGFAQQVQVKSFSKLANTLVKKAKTQDLHPEYGRQITANRHRSKTLDKPRYL